MMIKENLRDTTFSKSSIGGYRPSEVDNFVTQVAELTERLMAENIELERKIEVLAESIRDYRKTEATVQNAIISAQQTADSILMNAEHQGKKVLEEAEHIYGQRIEEANRQVVEILNKTKDTALRTIEDAKMQAVYITSKNEESIQKQLNQYNYLQREVAAFKTNVMRVFKDQIDKMAALETENTKINEFMNLSEKQNKPKPAEASAGIPVYEPAPAPIVVEEQILKPAQEQIKPVQPAPISEPISPQESIIEQAKRALASVEE